MNGGDVIKFDAKKNFTYLKPLGNGGTGDTHLFRDETTETLFAIKKYVPKDTRFIDDHYKRFVDEIKILFNISHPNIVRIYNYYLYPSVKTGFLQMEYIDGKNIDEFIPNDWGKDWNSIFKEAISAFEYLEQRNILHRDIRPTNILIDKNENIKLIDFGFGKQLNNAEIEENSILLNWPATEIPDEVKYNQEYNGQTEIYYVGTLFTHLLKDAECNFNYQHIIEKMVKGNPTLRYSSFAEIVSDISKGVLGEIDFSNKEKEIYIHFASELNTHIQYYIEKYVPINDIRITLSKLEQLIRNSSLENYIQNNSLLIDCFISCEYSYITRKDINIQTVIDFYSLLINLPTPKKKILLDNIYSRLATIRVDIAHNELPF